MEMVWDALATNFTAQPKVATYCVQRVRNTYRLLAAGCR